MSKPQCKLRFYVKKEYAKVGMKKRSDERFFIKGENY